MTSTRRPSTRMLIAGATLALAVAPGLAACGNDSEGTSTSVTTSAAPTPGIDAAEPVITEEQMVFVDELLADPLNVDEATAMIEAAGYTWRIGEIDGQGQPLTTDYVIDRLTLFVQDGTVVRAVWG